MPFVVAVVKSLRNVQLSNDTLLRRALHHTTLDDQPSVRFRWIFLLLIDPLKVQLSIEDSHRLHTRKACQYTRERMITQKLRVLTRTSPSAPPPMSLVFATSKTYAFCFLLSGLSSSASVTLGIGFDAVGLVD
jgi:hypothetical protein